MENMPEHRLQIFEHENDFIWNITYHILLFYYAVTKGKICIKSMKDS